MISSKNIRELDLMSKYRILKCRARHFIFLIYGVIKRALEISVTDVSTFIFKILAPTAVLI